MVISYTPAATMEDMQTCGVATKPMPLNTVPSYSKNEKYLHLSLSCFSLHVQQKDGSHAKHSLTFSSKAVTDETQGSHFVWRQIISILTYCVDGFGGLVASMLASRTQVCGFKPGRSRWIFAGVKTLSVPSSRGEVKESVPCPSFAACKRT